MELLAAWEREAESRGLDRYGVTVWADGEAWIKEHNPRGLRSGTGPPEPAVAAPSLLAAVLAHRWERLGQGR